MARPRFPRARFRRQARWDLASGGRVTRKREVALRLLRGEPVELLSRQLGVEIFRLEQWREKAIAGIRCLAQGSKGDPVKAELDIAMNGSGS